MDWQLFWTAFGAIGGTIGALATTAAVIVALWQTKHAERKKLKLIFSDSLSLISSGTLGPEEMFVGLSIINVGNRNVIIQNWGFDYHQKGKHALVGINQSRLARTINPSLPHELQIENKMDLYLEKKYFIENLREGIDKELLKSWLRVTFFAVDSTGKEYRVKSRKTVAQLIR